MGLLTEGNRPRLEEPMTRERLQTLPLEELAALAKDLGLPADEARAVLERRDFKEAVDRDWARSHQLGIRAVPTFILGPQILVGAQPYENWVELMAAAGIKKHLEKA